MEPYRGKVKRWGKIPNALESLPPKKAGKKITQADLKKRREKHLGNEETVVVGSVKKVNWQLVPSGSDWSYFETYFDSQVAQSGSNFEQKEVEEARERFKRISELKPKTIYRGLETFSDYFALLFEETDKVVLESINYGNAIYIIDGDWKVQSRKTKSELKKVKSTKIIHHRRDWFSKLKNYLQIGFE